MALRLATAVGLCLASAVPSIGDPLVINNVAAPTTFGSGDGERALWVNAGSVGGTPIDLVATISGASLDHTFTASGSRPSLTSAGQDDVWVQWRIFQAGTYNINTDTGGVPVVADVHVQLNDIDGPNNERAYLPVCSGAVQWVRIDQDATTGKSFGTVDGRPETFSLIGDANYNSEPHSGVEVFYPNTSTFTFGRTANTSFFIRVDNPTYSAFDTFDFACADFTVPVAVDDTGEGTLGVPLVLDILANDSISTANDNPPHNNSQAASEYGRQSVSLIPPGGATGVTADASGDTVSFSMPGQGTWSFNDTTGLLTFTPIAGFAGTPTAISYTFENALGVTSNAATVTIDYPSIGVVKGATYDDNLVADGFSQVGETITYSYTVTAIGSTPIGTVTLSETGFTGNGTTPSPAYLSGDLDADGRLDPGESWLYQATYTLVAADLVAGSVANQATASGATALGTPVSDLSDSNRAGDGNGIGTPGGGANNNDPTTMNLPFGAIVADDDAPAAVGGAAGDPNLGNAFANDTLDGSPVDPADVAATVLTPASHAGVTLDTATGTIAVAATTPAGTYTIGYRICETLNPANCDDATITVEVDPAAMDAVDDAPAAVNGMTGEPNAGNAFANDTLNGAPVSVLAISASIVTPASHGGVTLDTSDGTISIAASTPSGTYTIVYRVCELLNPANCDDATITIQVDQAVIDAVDDTVPGVVDTANALTNVVNVLNDDTLNGAAATIGDVTVSANGPLPAGFTLQMHGGVDIAQGTPSGPYTFGYRICEILNPANCDTAVVSVVVEKSVPVVAGTVYFDANGNGAFEPSIDTRLPGYTVDLVLAGTVVRTTVSGPDGSYLMRDFDPGSGYEVVFRDPATQRAVGVIPNLTFGVNSVLANQNQAIDPSGVIYNSTTGAPLAGVTIELHTAGGTLLPDACLLPGQQTQTTDADGRYRFDVVAGAAAECPAAEAEYRLVITAYPGGVIAGRSTRHPPLGGTLDATTCPGDAIPGGACQLSASIDAPPAGTFTPYYLAFLLQPGDPNVVNNHIPIDPLPTIPANGLSVTKRASVFSARRDDVVAYVIEASNANPTAAGPLVVRDALPPGFAYVRGTASVGGVAVEPQVSGRSLSFGAIVIPALGRLEIRLSTRIGADVVPGEHVNRAWMIDPATGTAISATATAVVRVEAEHVFDCGDVIGKVFEDANRNGVQDQGEKGIPGARIATVRGVLITTDRHGRYSVPCAELPDSSTGTNFILKLDTRTLPDGFSPTTENPLVVRLTAGKVSRMNFGAAPSASVRIEITGRAFAADGAHPGAELQAGIARLGSVADKEGAILSITYRSRGEPRGLVESRIAATKALVARVWRGRSGAALPFETRIVVVD